MTDSSGTVRARYDYDPYGRVTKVSGNVDSDFLYTGHYYHAPSGLHLALYRAYDADLGRWLNRDPIGESGGINLNAYVGNNPINYIDPLGLWNLFNPATWGDANAVGWSWTDSLIPWHESSGYTWDGIKKTSFEANAAFWDGANPFGNPYSDLYDAEEMATSCAIGNLTWHVETFLVGGAAFKALGKGVAGALGTDWAAMTGAQRWIAARGAIPAALWNSGVGGQFVVVVGVVPAVGYLAYNKGTEVIQDIGVIFTPVFEIFPP